MEKTSKHLEGIAGMGSSFSIANVIARMNRAMNGDNPEYDKIPETRDQVAQLLELYSMSGDPDDFERMIDYNYTTGLINARMKSISTNKIAEVIKEIDSFMRTEVDTALVDIEATGFSVFVRDFVKLVIQSSLISIFFSMVVVGLISFIFFRSLRWGIISILPLGSAVVLNFGLMGYFGIELSHITALMTSIMIGVGVDFAIHFIAHARELLHAGHARDHLVYETIDEVGRPILINAVSVALGFSVLLFSNFVPMRFLGALIGLSMLACAFGALTMMASIIHLMRERLQ
jgi:predicted RND superfamily exporter protein